MSTRKTPFVNGEFYHVYNRGVDKRIIFSDEYDMDRFLQSMKEFNVIDPIGSIYENSFRKNQLGNPTSKLEDGQNKLVNFIAFCVNPNHYHFLLEQLVDNGVSMFMKRLGGGYAKYFNEKHKRSGVLFQGRFKAEHVDTNEYLLHLSAYVNLNDRVHQLGNPTSKLVRSRSSWGEYVGEVGEVRSGERKNAKTKSGKMKSGVVKIVKSDFCSKDIILEQFRNKKEYRKFAESSLTDILERRADMKDVEKLLLE